LRIFFTYAVPGVTVLTLFNLARAMAAEPSFPGSDTPDLFMTGFKMIAALALVISLLWLTLYFMKRSNLRRSNLFGGRDMIRVLATRPLGPRKFIALVEVAGTVLTLGVTDEKIACLDKMEASAFHAALGSSTPASPSGEEGFAKRLKSLTSAKNGFPDQEGGQ
jgi:flagellar biosynthetic protein FliO